MSAQQSVSPTSLPEARKARETVTADSAVPRPRALTVADAVARTLVDQGILHVFGMPGGGSITDLVESGRRAGIEFILCHTEAAAGFAASVYGELTGRPGVFLTTLGPGVASACNAVAHAYLDRDPVLLITDCHPNAFDGMEHQRFDHGAVMGPITKRSTFIAADDVSATVTAALKLTTAGQPGPVHVDMAPDVSSMRLDEQPPASSWDVIDGGISDPAEALERARGLLRSAQKPIILAGTSARGPEAAAALLSFAEACRVPVLTTYKAKGIFPDRHKLHAGIVTGGTLEQPLIEQADLILAIGLDPVELIPRKWPYKQPVVYIGAWPHNSLHFEATSLVGEVSGLLHALLDDGEHRYAWELVEVQARKLEQMAKMRIPTAGLAPHRVVEIARELTPGDPIVTVDAGAHMFAATTFWQTGRPGGVLISNGLATMGYALPAAIGAGVVHPDVPIVCFTGDGGLLMCLGELETAARLHLNVIVVVFDDAALSLIKIKQDQKGFETAGVLFQSVDWRKVAEGFGCSVVTANDEASFAEAWKEALKMDGPVVVDAHVDPSGYRAMMQALRS